MFWEIYPRLWLIANLQKCKTTKKVLYCDIYLLGVGGAVKTVLCFSVPPFSLIKNHFFLNNQKYVTTAISIKQSDIPTLYFVMFYVCRHGLWSARWHARTNLTPSMNSGTVYTSDSEPDKSGSLPESSRTNPLRTILSVCRYFFWPDITVRLTWYPRLTWYHRKLQDWLISQ